MENGVERKTVEDYLVEALSFTEAEARIIEEMTPYISGEFTVTGVALAKYSEIYNSEDPQANRWFKCKLAFMTLDEKSGLEKKTVTNILVQAVDIRMAIKNLDEGMKGSMIDYVVASISETNIWDVYPFKVK